jgi:hypothetical protein
MTGCERRWPVPVVQQRAQRNRTMGVWWIWKMLIKVLKFLSEISSGLWI